MSRFITTAMSLRIVAKELNSIISANKCDVSYIESRAQELLNEAIILEAANGTWAERGDMPERLARVRAIKLKPCPFCGFTPEATDDDCIYPAVQDRTVWSINCYETGGGCATEILGDSPEDVVQKWNQRNGDV